MIICALALGIPGALGFIRWEGTPIPLPFLSLDKSRSLDGYSNPSKKLNAFLGFSFGGIFGLCIAFAIGALMPTHMVVVEETKLTPVHLNGQTFYVGLDPESDHASFFKEADGGLTRETIIMDDTVSIYQDNPSGGILAHLEPAFLGKGGRGCNLFACLALSKRSARYEFHIPENGVGKL